MAASSVGGWNAAGQLGDDTTNRPAPVNVVGLESGVQDITAGDMHTCAIVAGGVRCWGDNRYGQLGVGSTESYTTPVQVVALPVASRTSTLAARTCAVTAAGGLKCWGRNASGQLGNRSAASPYCP